MLDRHPDKIGVGARFHEAKRTAGTVLASTGGMVEIFAGASSQPEYEQWLERAQAYLPLKEAGLYVDVDREGKLVSEPPMAISRDRCKLLGLRPFRSAAAVRGRDSAGLPATIRQDASVRIVGLNEGRVAPLLPGGSLLLY